MRPLHPRAAARGRGPRGLEHRRGRATGQRGAGALGGARRRSRRAELYGCAVLSEGVEDEPDNVTRFVWVAPEGTEPEGEGPWRTSLVFSELGEDKPGALVDALQAFSEPGRQPDPDRVAPAAAAASAATCSSSTSRAAARRAAVAEAIEELRGHAESVRVLGSYPIGAAERRSG